MLLLGLKASYACGGRSLLWMAPFAAGTAEFDVRLTLLQHLDGTPTTHLSLYLSCFTYRPHGCFYLMHGTLGLPAIIILS